MTRLGQRGSGKLSTVIFLGLLALVGFAAWKVIPVYYEHYDLVDKVNEICRTPRYKVRGGDEEILRLLMKEVNERRMGTWIGPESFQISTTEHNRQIRMYYERPAEIAPSINHTFKFDFTADQPLI